MDNRPCQSHDCQNEVRSCSSDVHGKVQNTNEDRHMDDAATDTEQTRHIPDEQTPSHPESKVIGKGMPRAICLNHISDHMPLASSLNGFHLIEPVEKEIDCRHDHQ